MIKKTVLENGVRILTETIPYVHSVSVGYWVATGSKFEAKHEQGASHFIEHMFFKGTKNRNAKDIAESLETVGGQLNAFTTKENTCYYFKVLKEDLELGLDVLSDIFLNSEFNPKEVEKEKNVILEEINMYEDTPDELVHDMAQELVLPSHPLGRTVLGTQTSIKDMKRDYLLTYIKERYTGDNIVISAAGNVEHDELVQKVANKFSELPAKGRKYDLSPPVYNNSFFIKEKDVEQVHLNIALPGIDIFDDDIYSLHVLNSLLGGGMSSRLFQEIREQRGLAYSVYSYHASFLDFGLFGIYAASTPANAQQVVETSLLELKKLTDGDISDKEIQNNKTQLKGGLLLGLENIGSRMSRLGRSELVYDRVVSAEEVADKVMAVKKEDIIILAKKLFKPDLTSIIAVAPKDFTLDKEAIFNKIL